MTEISGIPNAVRGRALDASETAPQNRSASEPQSRSFKELLLDGLNDVNRLQKEADQGVQRLLAGETDNVPEVLVAVNKAGLAFDLLMEIRNKLTDAYREIQQMRL